MTMVIAKEGDTQNQAWAADKGRFGFKMLQMMGWSEGKGLGINMDGTTAHIKMKKKDNSRGLGAEIGQNDRWDSTMGGFNETLAKLAAQETSGGDGEKDKKKKKKKKKDGKDGGSAKKKKRKRDDGDDEAAAEAKKEKRRRKEERAAKRVAKAERREKKLVFAKRRQNKQVSNYSSKALAEIFGQAEVVKETDAPEESMVDERGRLQKRK